MERYRDFREVTESALRAPLSRELHMDQAERTEDSHLMAAYQSPAAFPEVKPVIQKSRR